MRILLWIKKYALPFLLTAFVFAVLYGLEHWEVFQSARSEVQKRSIPDSMLRLGKTGKVVRLFEYRSQVNVDLEGIDGGLAPEELPSSIIIAEVALNTGSPVISVVAEPEDLYHPDTGIIANPFKRGMGWERPAYVSYFEHGKLLFGSGVGLRVHGGRSRGHPKKSFRLVFREMYGEKSFGPGILFEGRGDPIRSLIVHNDLRSFSRNGAEEHWRFMNPLAYDIARRIGCLTPETKPVQFYLNGKYQGPYFLTEHLTEEYLKARFGHNQFIFARTKKGKGSKVFKMGNREVYENFLAWPQRAESPFTLKKVAEKVDIDNLSRWFISVLYCGTTDPFQGPLLLDQARPNAKWFWINWDMDQSFMDFHMKVSKPWELDTFDDVLNNPWNKRRTIILSRLQKESPEYREYFQELFTKVLNHKLTTSFLNSRIDYYEKVAIDFRVDDRQFIANYREYHRNTDTECSGS